MSDSFAERLEMVEQRIAAACEKAGRPRDSVRLLAVSKTKPAEAVQEAAACGLRLFGENKVQEAQLKVPVCPQNLEWHLIGHLQSNKARIAANLFHMIHSVDSVKLMEALDSHAATALPILLQVNVSGESSKSGMKPDEVADAVEAANRMSKGGGSWSDDHSAVYARSRKGAYALYRPARVARSDSGRNRDAVAGAFDGDVARS